MSYLIRYRHPETGELIQRRQNDYPLPRLKVPIHPRVHVLAVSRDPSDPPSHMILFVAEYECRQVYTTCDGEPIYDYWRIS